MTRSDAFSKYIQSIGSKFSYSETSEMGYRSDFEELLRSIFTEINVSRIDHDAKAYGGNKPDYVVYKDVPILYIEAKDIGVSLDKIEKSDQMARYFGYANLVLTDYVEFRFYRNGVRYEEPISIAAFDKKSRQIAPHPDRYEHLVNSLLDFTRTHKEPIKSGLHLARIMGGKALRIRDNVKEFMTKDGVRDSELYKVFESIRNLLVHDLNPDSFADLYAQTLVYGLFVARFHDESPQNFTRQEARDLVPPSNPFLRHFFDHIVGPNFDKRLEYIVNELCEVFSHAEVEKLLEDYYKSEKNDEKGKGPDPVIHFYEDFLKEYDPELRKRMGAYYTPQPVVNFIVRSVDEILKRDFGLAGGLADTTKNEDGLHKVQVLDPATGTGTFFSAVIGHIYKGFVEKKQEGRWPAYVHNDLLPRIHGFELMMAPYTIAHLKLSMAFKKTGFKYFNDRLGIYLTNSLDGQLQQTDMFSFGLADSIAKESAEATKIKNKTPIMVVVGNPPYSVSSQNKGEWIQNLIKDYKKDLNEKKINLDDDYIKFIRFSEHFVEKNGSGIVAMITNNSFIDGITHRQMRKHLLETFDDIYIIDLHGNVKKREVALDGGKDENVFDIQQGVSINIFVKKEDQSKNTSARIKHIDLYGKREQKFAFLSNNDISSINWNELMIDEPYYFFKRANLSFQTDYSSGFKIDELVMVSNTGIQTKNDALSINYDKGALLKIREDFIKLSVDELKAKYKLKDSSGWQVGKAKATIMSEDYLLADILYRPFDFRKILYTQKEGFIGRPRYDTAKHILKGNNLSLITLRLNGENNKFVILVSRYLVEKGSLASGNYSFFPLYIYNPDGSKTPNLNPEILTQIKAVIGEFTPEDLFDYIYAVLHSPSYREKYKEFLKIDFPRVPYPTDRKQFDDLVKLGHELRELHLMESPKLKGASLPFPESGSDTVEKVEYKGGRVYINSTQYFGEVPEVTWNFYIGGYQPAQKWLKDRKGRVLTNEDIEHYQKIVFVLEETGKLMKEIDNIFQSA